MSACPICKKTGDIVNECGCDPNNLPPRPPVERKPWWRQPGEVFDAKGYPIYPGDLIRTPHFIGARRKRYYLYHTAVFVNGYMELVPTSHLHPENVKRGGRCLLSEDIVRGAEIIAGHGPEPFISYEDRPRRKPESEAV